MLPRSFTSIVVEGGSARLTVLILLLGGCTFGDVPKYSVESLPEYDALFCRERGWTGADAVYSVALSDDLTLWLFSDTWVGDVVDGKHKDATMVNNSIGLQRGTDARDASVEFFWGRGEGDKHEAFVKPADCVGWFWIFDGMLADGKLHLFLLQTVKTGEKGVFGFRHIGMWLAEIGNPQDEPAKWRIQQHKLPWGRFEAGGNLFFGSALMRDGDFVYIYGASEDWSKGMSGRSMIVARARPDQMSDFGTWRFFSDGRWRGDINRISELFGGAAPEYSVSYQPAIKRYVAVYTENGMSENILMRLAPTPAGPWGRAYKIYECPEVGWHESYFCYAAKAHPEISKEDELIVTYVCNSTDFWQMAKDARIYRPRFLRITFDANQN